MNIILGNLLETFEFFTKKIAAGSKTPYFVAAEHSGWAGYIVTPGRSLMMIWSGSGFNCYSSHYKTSTLPHFEFWSLYLNIFDQNHHLLCKKLQFLSTISKYKPKNSKCGRLKPISDTYSIIISVKMSKNLVNKTPS